MKSIFWTAALFLLLLVGHAASSVYADDDRNENGVYQEHGEKEDAAEEWGEGIGLSSVALAGGAGMLFLVRRTSSILIKTVPFTKEWLVFIMPFLKRWHAVLGILALCFSIVHGFVMYWAEGELGIREWLGVIAVVLGFVAALPGLSMIGKKKSSLNRKLHIRIFSVAGILAFVHIIAS